MSGASGGRSVTSSSLASDGSPRGVERYPPLEAMYRGARTLRFADGPDEVHRIVIAKNVPKHYAAVTRGTSESEGVSPLRPI